MKKLMYLMCMSLVTLFLASCDMGGANDEATPEAVEATVTDSTEVVAPTTDDVTGPEVITDVEAEK